MERLSFLHNYVTVCLLEIEKAYPKSRNFFLNIPDPESLAGIISPVTIL